MKNKWNLSRIIKRGDKKVAKKTKNNTLTVKQSKNLGADLTNIMTGLQGLRHHANTLMIVKHAGADNGLLRHEMDNFLEHKAAKNVR